jgi:hypothetical protein
VAILFGFVLRIHGIDWGTAADTGEFQAFHPDERTLVENVRWVGEDLRRVEMPYGLFPAYMLWGASRLSGISVRPETNAEKRRLYVLARALTVLLATATIWLTFAIGYRVGGRPTAVLSAMLMAFCYGHIQQSHYYTVDPILTALVTLCLLGILQLPDARMLPYALSGMVAGLATGTRLVAVLLAVPLLVQHLPPGWRRAPGAAIGALFNPRIAVFFLAMGVAAVACEPFAVLDPERFFSEGAVLTWMKSLEVSLGESVFIWSLYDFATTPYLFHITDTLPYALGTPLVMVTWIAVYFAVVGGHHLKPVRYIVPLLPIHGGRRGVGVFALPQAGEIAGTRCRDHRPRGGVLRSPGSDDVESLRRD